MHSHVGGSLQECSRLEGQLQAALQASSQRPSSEDLAKLHAELATTSDQLSTSQKAVQQLQLSLQVWLDTYTIHSATYHSHAYMHSASLGAVCI